MYHPEVLLGCDALLQHPAASTCNVPRLHFDLALPAKRLRWLEGVEGERVSNIAAPAFLGAWHRSYPAAGCTQGAAH
jgi:hypothetical protein